MINIAIQQDNYKKKDETYSLRILLSSKGKQAKIVLPYSFPKGWWKHGKIQKEFGGRGKIEWNSIIQKHINDMQDFLLKIEAHKYTYAPEEVKRMWLSQRSGSIDFTAYYKEEIERLKSENRDGTARAHDETLTKLTQFRKNIQFNDITVRFLEEFNTFMKDLKPNSRGKHFRQLRAIVYRAKDVDGIEVPESFKKYRIPREKTRKRNLSIADLIKIKNAELDGFYQHARDFFMFQFYMGGMSFVDAYRLPPSQKKYVTYERHKIDEKRHRAIITTIVPAQAKEFLSNKSTPKDYEGYRAAMELTNKRLKRVAKIAGIKPFSTHMARHSWATIAKREGYTKDFIAEMLGHKISNTQMTDIYTDEYEQEERDKCVIHIASLIN